MKEKLRQQKVWQGSHREINFKIVNWQFNTPMIGFAGNWNYYIYLPESKCVDFAKLWLRDKVKSFSEGGRKHVLHDYENISGDMDFHGGCTYYAKHGHAKGFRSVEFGCDYQHYCDEGKDYNEDYLLHDACHSIDRCFENGILKKEQDFLK